MVSFHFVTMASEYMALPNTYLSCLLWVMSGPTFFYVGRNFAPDPGTICDEGRVLFCVGKQFEQGVEFRPTSGEKARDHTVSAPLQRGDYLPYL